MFWMFNRKSTTVSTPAIQELCWTAVLANEQGYLITEWGKARYDAQTDTVSMQYVTNNLDGTVNTVVKQSLTVAETLAELATLRQRKGMRTWNYLENTWQSSLKTAMEAVQVSSSFCHSITHPPIADNYGTCVPVTA